MTTYAQEKGFIIGKQYRLKTEMSGIKAGTIVTFQADDGTGCPGFAHGGRLHYIYLTVLEPVEDNNPIKTETNTACIKKETLLKYVSSKYPSDSFLSDLVKMI